jgi:WD40 repeat protein
VLYTLCAGRPPFRADTTAEVLDRVRANAPPPVREMNPDVPEWLGGLIGRLHAREASARPASAREVADLLGGQLALLQQPPLTPPLPAAPVVPVQTARRTPGVLSSRRRAVAICLVGLLAALAALAVLLLLWHRKGPKPGEEDELLRKKAGPVEPLELRREDISPRLLALAGGGDPAQSPPELAAVLGDGRFLFPRVGNTAWMDQSPDGKVLAAPLHEDVILFEATTGEYIRSLKGAGGRVVWVNFSRDSQLLVATTWHNGQGGAVRVWDLPADRELYTNPQPGPKVGGAAAFSADGKRLVAEGDDMLRVWDARSGQEVQTVELRPGGVPSLCFSPDGRHLAVALWGGQGMKIFDWDGERLGAVQRREHRLPVEAVAYSPDGKFLASGDASGFKLWNAETLEEVRTVATPARQLAFAPDSRTLFAALTSVGQPKAVHTFTRWDVVTGEELPSLAVEVSADPAWAHHYLRRDGKVLFVVLGGAATYVQAIDTATGKELFSRVGHRAPLNAVAVSPDGRTAASASEDGAVKLWDLATRRVRYSLKAHTTAVWGLAFSADGKRLASGSRDGTIALWDVGSGTLVRALLGHARSVSRIAFSPDGQTLAAGGENGKVKLWDVGSGQEQSSLFGHNDAVRGVAFSPDGTRLASGGEDRSVRLHDLVNGGSRKFPVAAAVNHLAFAPDGRTLAAVGDAPEAEVRLWDLDTGEETTWEGHTGHVQGLAFSPVGSLVATGGADGTVRLWDRHAGPAGVRTIGPGPFGGAVRAVGFTPVGRYLATANANGTVYLLRVGPPSR